MRVRAEPAELVVLDDRDAVARAAAGRVAAILTAAVTARGRADWATTGGSAAPDLYRQLVAPPIRDDVPWPDVHVWWGDDRLVPRDHKLSNVRPFDEIVMDPIGGLPIAAEHLHPFRVERTGPVPADAAQVAADLDLELRAAGLPVQDDWPILDLVLLGVGGDGHILSVFPGSAALTAAVWVLPIPAPTHIEPNVARVTLNPALVTAARHVLVVASGSAKAAILATILGPVRDPVRWPAQLALTERATWLIDEAAASQLGR